MLLYKVSVDKQRKLSKLASIESDLLQKKIRCILYFTRVTNLKKLLPLATSFEKFSKKKRARSQTSSYLKRHNVTWTTCTAIRFVILRRRTAGCEHMFFRDALGEAAKRRPDGKIKSQSKWWIILFFPALKAEIFLQDDVREVFQEFQTKNTCNNYG